MAGPELLLRSTHAVIRRGVLATNRWPVLGSAYRLAYRAALRAVVRRFRDTPGVAGIWVRNTAATGQSVPGLSDIDLTFVLDDVGAPAGQLALARRTVARYEELRRWFPMLGEVEILEPALVDAWGRHALAGLEPGSCRSLHGRVPAPSGPPGTPQEIAVARLARALVVYRQHVLPAAGPAVPTRIGRLTLHRSAQKLLRCLEVAPPRDLHLVPPAAVAAAAHEALAVHARQVLSALAADPGSGPESYLPGDAWRRVRRRHAPELAGLPLTGAVASATEPARVYLVPHRGLTRREFARLFLELRGRFRPPLLMDPDVFAAYLLLADPLEHFTLVREREVLHGDDLLPLPLPLGPATLRTSVCRYAVHVLTGPYVAQVLLLESQAFHDLLFGWYLRTLRFLEEGSLCFDYRRLAGYHHSRHPEYGDLESTPTSELDRFALLRRIALDVATEMAGPPAHSM